MYRCLAIVLVTTVLFVGTMTGEWEEGIINCGMAFAAFALVLKFFEKIGAQHA